MSSARGILLIPISVLLSYTGCEDKITQDGGQMCAEKACVKKPVSNNQITRAPSDSERKLLKVIFDSVIQSGRVPTPERISDELKTSVDDVIHLLNGLESKDLLLRKEGTQKIISIYPFSMDETHHQILLESGRRLFAMCAVDALGMPAMFNMDVGIISRCEKCKQEITIRIIDQEIASKSHPDIKIWRMSREKPRSSAETCCPRINFFCSNKHVEQWKAENPGLAGKGFVASLELAFPKIKKQWKEYGESIGVR